MATSRDTSMPNWVKWFVWAGVVVVVIVGIMLATGHGPWEHMHMSGMH
jgi:hypothetical protein